MTITYPADFKARVLAEYPEDRDLPRVLEEGAEYPLIRWLDELADTKMDCERIVHLLSTNQVERLREEAERGVRQRELQREFDLLWAKARAGIPVGA